MKKTIVSCALMSAMLYAAPGFALDVYPGTACHAVGQNANAINYTLNGQAANAAAMTIDIVCPITRENPAEVFENVKIVVSDRHTTQNITCSAVSAQADGAGYANSKSSTQYHPEWYQSETLTIAPTGFNSPAGTYYIRCTLPPAQNGKQSWVASYSVAEKCALNVGASDTALLFTDYRHAHGVTTIDCQ